MYGVVIEDGVVDVEETQALRHELRKRRQYFDVTDGGSDDYDERGCRICRLSPRAAGRIGVGDGDMVEYVSSTTAPLRAWTKIEGDGSQNGAPIGPIGRGILKVESGDVIWIRKLETKAMAF